MREKRYCFEQRGASRLYRRGALQCVSSRGSARRIRREQTGMRLPSVPNGEAGNGPKNEVAPVRLQGVKYDEYGVSGTKRRVLSASAGGKRLRIKPPAAYVFCASVAQNSALAHFPALSPVISYLNFFVVYNSNCRPNG
ncbi:hypothetical protein FJU30_07795 [Affinibrenneria salicis]|uniref:Uncharacterized protein n=1 Tax=Affinibrenneria salicis TaxID=2590031 RepID=A0A5J5G4K7_9GAMM|nr:hypothetical protein [Affinibrenneria salicis]KAA9001144.1 hypothetical protein FJU30_07795 [Affinibrenneria salicis]